MSNQEFNNLNKLLRKVLKDSAVQPELDRIGFTPLINNVGYRFSNSINAYEYDYNVSYGDNYDNYNYNEDGLNNLPPLLNVENVPNQDTVLDCLVDFTRNLLDIPTVNADAKANDANADNTTKVDGPREKLYELLASQSLSEEQKDMLRKEEESISISSSISSERTDELISNEEVIQFENTSDRLNDLSEDSDGSTIEVPTTFSTEELSAEITSSLPTFKFNGDLVTVVDTNNVNKNTKVKKMTNDNEPKEPTKDVTPKSAPSNPDTNVSTSNPTVTCVSPSVGDRLTSTKVSMGPLPADDGIDWNPDLAEKRSRFGKFAIVGTLLFGLAGGIGIKECSSNLEDSSATTYPVNNTLASQNLSEQPRLEDTLAVIISGDVIASEDFTGASEVIVPVVPIINQTTTSNSKVVVESVVCYNAEERATAEKKLTQTKRELSALKVQYATLESQLDTLVDSCTSEQAQTVAKSATDAKQANSLIESIYALRANLKQTEQKLLLTQVMYEKASKQYDNTKTCDNNSVSNSLDNSTEDSQSTKVLMELTHRIASLTQEVKTSEKAYQTALAEMSKVYGAYLDQVIESVPLRLESRYLAIKTALNNNNAEAVMNVVVMYIDGIDGSADQNGNIILPFTKGCDAGQACTEALGNLYNAMTGLVGRKDDETQAKFVEVTYHMCTKNINPKDGLMRFKIVN